METMENVSKMSLAASKAWITRRANAANSSSSKTGKNEKNKKGKTDKVAGKAVNEKQTIKDENMVSGDLKAIEAQEMKVLNGIELEKLAEETQKKLDRKQKMEDAKTGKKVDRAGIIGGVIKKAKIERFNGGVKVSGVA